MQRILTLSEQMNTKRKFIDKYNHCKTFFNLNDQGFTNYLLPHPWVQAFLDGESTFYNYISDKNENKKYVTCDSSLEIAQNSHDVYVLIAISHFFGAGYIKPKYQFSNIDECLNSRSVNRFIIRDTNKIIKFLDQYPLKTRKQLDYLDWKRIVELKNSGQHLSTEGFDLILQIKNRMNARRDKIN